MILESMGANFVFAIGYEPQLIPHEDSIDRTYGRYVISMKTDIWPYVPNYEGRNITPMALRSSMWRPDPFNALWEEVFHTVTEA